MALATTTRAELRLRAARKTGDVWEAVATANGTTTTLIDLDHLSYQNNYFKGREAIAISGTASNIVSGTGLIRRIDSSTGSTGTITFGRALTAATTAADVYHIFNYRDNGLYVRDWNGFIDEAIDAIRDTILTEVVSDNQAFVATSPVISVNSSLGLANTTATGADVWGICGADIQDSAGIWHQCSRGSIRVDRANRSVELMGRTKWMADGLNIRIRGYIQASLPTADNSTTNADPIFVQEFAAARALTVLSRRLGPDGSTAWQEAQKAEAAAEARKIACRTRIKPGTWRLD